jgi:cell division protease FtsH
VLLGGRTAEEILFDNVISTGAQNDLERATDIARAMVVEYGMSQRVGPLSFGRDGFRGSEGRLLFPGAAPELSDDLASLVDDEIKRLVGEAHDRAIHVLNEHRDFLEKMSRILILTEVIDGPDLHAYFEGSKPIPTIEELRREMTGNGRERDTVATGPDVVLQPPANG